MFEDVAIFCVRLANALIWTVLGYRILRGGTKAVHPFTRRLIIVLLVAGYWLLSSGGLVQLIGLPGDLVRLVYTAYTAAAGVIGIALISAKDKI